MTSSNQKKLDPGNRLPTLAPPPFQLEGLPDEDWFFRTMREAAIARSITYDLLVTRLLPVWRRFSLLSSRFRGRSSILPECE